MESSVYFEVQRRSELVACYKIDSESSLLFIFWKDPIFNYLFSGRRDLLFLG